MGNAVIEDRELAAVDAINSYRRVRFSYGVMDCGLLVGYVFKRYSFGKVDMVTPIVGKYSNDKELLLTLRKRTGEEVDTIEKGIARYVTQFGFDKMPVSRALFGKFGDIAVCKYGKTLVTGFHLGTCVAVKTAFDVTYVSLSEIVYNFRQPKVWLS